MQLSKYCQEILSPLLIFCFLFLFWFPLSFYRTADQTMLITRSLLHGQITLSEAQKKETNILQELTYVTLAANFKEHIEKNSATIKKIVAHHLHLSSSCINISDRSEWLNGSFNLCVPISIQCHRSQRCDRRVLIRFPLPYKTAESFRPGNGDEKIRCEAATYAWLSEECPDIPIACLQGFGLSTGQGVRVHRPE